jgi:hypothetical protein
MAPDTHFPLFISVAGVWLLVVAAFVTYPMYFRRTMADEVKDGVGMDLVTRDKVNANL